MWACFVTDHFLFVSEGKEFWALEVQCCADAFYIKENINNDTQISTRTRQSSFECLSITTIHHKS